MKIIICLVILLEMFLMNPIKMVGWTKPDEEKFQQEITLLVDKLGGISVYNAIYGEMTVTLHPSADGYSCWSSMNCYGNISLIEGSKHEGILLHEMGHIFLNNLGLRTTNYSIGYYDNGTYVHVSGLNPVTWKYERTSLGYPHAGQPYEQHGAAVSQSWLEDFADMFRAWVLDDFSDDQAGMARKEFMDNFIKQASGSYARVEMTKLRKQKENSGRINWR